MKYLFSFFIGLIFSSLMGSSLIAQSETALAREGNNLYSQGQHVDAELRYKKSLRANEDSDLEASVYNLGNALYQQQRFDEAIEQYNTVVSTIKNKSTRADAFHNLGNIYMAQQNMEEAIEMFKSSLRLDPNDDESRYNLAYAKELLKNESKEEKEERKKDCDNPKESDEEQEEKEQEQEDKEKKDQEEKEDEEKKDQEEKKDEEQKDEEQKDEEQKDEEQKDEENKDEEQKDQEEKEKKEQEEKEGEEGEEEEPKPEEGENNDEKQDSLQQAQDQQKMDSLAMPPQQLKLSKEEILRMLETMKNEEMKVQEKLRGYKNGKGQTNKSDKDW